MKHTIQKFFSILDEIIFIFVVKPEQIMKSIIYTLVVLSLLSCNSKQKEIKSNDNQVIDSEKVVKKEKISQKNKNNQINTKKLEAKKNKKMNIEISMDSASSRCRIADIYEEDGKVFVSLYFNYTEETEGESGYSVIEDPKMRTFILNSATSFPDTFTVLDIERLKRIINEQKKSDKEELKKIKENKKYFETNLYPYEAWYQPFNITVKGGFIVEILENNAG